MNPDRTLPANRLLDESSLYLRRHAYHPVDWYPWGEEAIARAVAQDRPILLSIGYASNRWCGLMERESFEDERIGAFLDSRFVCVKVDREERPDLDAHFMEALQQISGEAAYPITIFLTSEGKPFYAGSYYPPEARDGLPAFGSVLNEVAVQWNKHREQTNRKAAEIELDSGRRLTDIPDREQLQPAHLQQAVFTIQSAFDEVAGGFGDAPKFPQSSTLEFMLRAAARGVGRATAVVGTTLQRMARGGIYDQIGGGFHRCTVDRLWQVPRFEKLLSDNALLARLYTHAWQQLKDPLYERVVLDTLEYLQRELGAPSGVFYSSEGADSEGAQGRYYTWTYEELEMVAPGSAERYGATRSGNFEGVNVLSGAFEDPPAAARAALLKRRSERQRPLRDEKVLTSWNGLAVGALAEAGATFDRPDLTEAARRAASWLLERQRDPATGRIYHTFTDSRHNVPGLLEDYAYLADGLYTLWEITFEPHWFEQCRQLCNLMIELFRDSAEGGLFTTSADHEKLIARRKEYLDPAIPAPAAVAAHVFQRMGKLAGSSEFAEMGAEIVREAQPHVQGIFLDAGAMLCAFDAHLASATQIVIAGSLGDARTRQMRRLVWQRYLPDKVCAGKPPGILSPLLVGKEAVDGNPTTYVSRADLRKPAVTDPAELAQALIFWSPPSAGQVKRVVGLIDNALRRRHFFDNLQNPAWIAPLRQAGLFAAAPAPILDYDEETVGSPPWPQSRYLARMAQFSPQEVLEIVLELSDANNVQVHEDLADAALAMPPELSRQLVTKAAGWLDSPYQLYLPEKLGKLAGRLAEGGHGDAAVELAVHLLALKLLEAPVKLKELRPAPEPRGLFGNYDYEQILLNDFPSLVKAVPLNGLATICDLLEKAIDISFSTGPTGVPEDLSYLWRPAIYPSDQNADKTLREPLASAAAEAVELVAREQPLLVPRMVELLEGRRWRIFHRMALHVLRVWPEVAPALIRERLFNRALFDDPHFHHEYFLLARDHLEQLSGDEQAVILSWLEEGPELAAWRFDPAAPGSGATSAQIERYRKLWLLKRLTLLEDHLPEAYKERLAALTEELGPVGQPEFVVCYSGKRSDPTTPTQADELHFDRLEEVLRLLANWQPTEGLGNPTVDGLARKLAQVVATEPVQFARSARRFKGVHPLYLWAVLHGLREGSEAFRFEWAPAIDLAAWMVEASRQDPGAWRPARLEAARLLSRAFAQGAQELSIDLRSRAWEVLEPLTDDPDPTAGEDAGSSPDSAAARSVETVRCEAMHALVRYGLWLRRQMESMAAAREMVRRGFDEMPEVREVLQRHLDPQQDSSPAIRAVYGRWFAWLTMLDGPWAKAHIAQIFPADAGLEELNEAAWEALISFSPAYDHLLALIEPQYRRGAELVARFDRRPAGKAHPESRLAEHLMVFYLRGRLALDDQGPLGTFFAGSSDRLRRHALGFVGRSLHNQKGSLPMEFALRLQTLWEKRAAAAERGEPGAHAEELSAFGWWFASAKLDTSWSFKQLRRALDLGTRLEAATQVVARLKELAGTHPEASVRMLALMLAGEHDSVTLLAWTEDARALIDQAINSADPAARAAAAELLRFFDVRELEELVRWE
ncbi:MAG: thioredoxin domain-containing protein [Actinomycetota bacterium]